MLLAALSVGVDRIQMQDRADARSVRGEGGGACEQLLGRGLVLAVLRLGRVRGFLALPDLLAGSGE